MPEVQENEFKGTLDQKIERLVFYATRHGMMLTAFNESLQDVQARLRSLEDDRARRAVQDARQEEQHKAVLLALASLQTTVGEQKGLIYKAIGIIVTGVMLAVLNLVLVKGA